MDIELFDPHFNTTDEFDFDLGIDHEYLVFDDTDLDFSDASDDKTILD